MKQVNKKQLNVPVWCLAAGSGGFWGYGHVAAEMGVVESVGF